MKADWNEMRWVVGGGNAGGWNNKRESEWREKREQVFIMASN